MSDDFIIRPCGGTWIYCNGDCKKCCKKSMDFSNKTVLKSGKESLEQEANK